MADLTVSFELYNEETVRILKEEDPDLLPDYSVNSSKDLAYNKKQVTSAITSGIIKGESIPKIAANLQSTIENLNESSAVSAARTAAIAAQNTGSLSAMKRLAEMGVEVQKEWVATLDSRTRPSHRALDGQRRDLDEAFSNGLQYPGASGDPAERWNCRCKIKAYMPKYDSEDEPRLTYSEWTAYKKATGNSKKKITASEYNTAKLWNRTLNKAKAVDSIFLSDDTDYYKYTPEGIVQEMNSSSVGEKAVKTIETTNVVITITDGEWTTGYRGITQGNSIILYQNNIGSVRVAAQTVIHELVHYEYGIGKCQHAEAICFAFEKMHIMGRDYLTKQEWEYVKQLAIDNYPEYEWEEGGYGNYEQFDFVRE